MSRTLDLVRENVKAGRIRVSEHGMAELSDDGIDLLQVIDGLAGARVIEDYPDYHKGPSVLCLQHDADDRPIHVLTRLDPNFKRQCGLRLVKQLPGLP